MSAPLPNMRVALDWEIAQDGDRYIIRRPISFDHAYQDPQGEDCSELQLLACRQACLEAGLPQDYLFPYDVSNTVGMYYHARDRGWLRSVAAGVALEGAIMLKGRDWGNGAAGHTSMSDGKGRQFAAHSSRLPAAEQVGWAPMVASYYQDSIIFPPDIAFYPQRDQIPVDPAALAFLARVAEWAASFDHERVDGGRKYGYLQRGDTNGRVSILNDLLIHFGYMGPARKSNTYTKYTQAAVTHMKRAAGLSGGGRQLGAAGAHALLAPK